MTATYCVSRQRQYPDGDLCVEISAGGIDYMNPDALACKYLGELEEYTGLVAATEAAIKIAERWKSDMAKSRDPEPIYIATGYTGGYTMPFSGEEACKEVYERLLEEAKEHDAKLPKCARCGEILSDKKDERYGNPWTVQEEIGDDQYPFCSDNCAMLAYQDEELEDEEEDEDND